ncbi:tyrosine-type recombinase/integrase [Saccharopolyspora shandongensis]|uniref:tyrosine-type recombinase/integrase n=1 Tax=Saccharopolyspora shandongensis TaxID=418495 RepID=UPI00341D2855
MTFHTLRKTFATLLEEAGLTARQVAELLGHSHVSMTQDNYFGRGQESRADALAFLDSPEESASRSRKIGNLLATRAQDGTRRPSCSDPQKQRTPCWRGFAAVSTRRAPEGIRTPNLLIRSRSLIMPRRFAPSAPIRSLLVGPGRPPRSCRIVPPQNLWFRAVRSHFGLTKSPLCTVTTRLLGRRIPANRRTRTVIRANPPQSTRPAKMQRQ